MYVAQFYCFVWTLQHFHEANQKGPTKLWVQDLTFGSWILPKILTGAIVRKSVAGLHAVHKWEIVSWHRMWRCHFSGKSDLVSTTLWHSARFESATYFAVTSVELFFHYRVYLVYLPVWHLQITEYSAVHQSLGRWATVSNACDSCVFINCL